MTECEAQGGVSEYCSAKCAVFADNAQLEKQKLELTEQDTFWGDDDDDVNLFFNSESLLIKLELSTALIFKPVNVVCLVLVENWELCVFITHRWKSRKDAFYENVQRQKQTPPQTWHISYCFGLAL